jgi:hypothetical protein
MYRAISLVGQAVLLLAGLSMAVMLVVFILACVSNLVITKDYGLITLVYERQVSGVVPFLSGPIHNPRRPYVDWWPRLLKPLRHNAVAYS